MNLLSAHRTMGFAFSVLAAWVLVGWITTAPAQTPDGETPAQEAVCDPLKADGVTKGLYGLCIAFCEAQDWETDCLEDPGACGRSGDRLLANYNKKKKETDPPMPCLVSAIQCPCWNGDPDPPINGATTLADLWLANTPSNCVGVDTCRDNFDDEDMELQSTASCQEGPDPGPDNRFVTEARVFETFGRCVVILHNDGQEPISLNLLLDLPTAGACLAEHDEFTAGGTFPDYVNTMCGLPTPMP